jgi:hypothetical protein
MLVGVRLQVRPVLGEIVDERATVPANPLNDVMDIAEVPLAPAKTVTLVGLAASVKS